MAIMRSVLGMILQRGGRSSVGNLSRVSKKNLMGGGGGGAAKMVALFLPCVAIGVVTGYCLGAYFANKDRLSEDEEERQEVWRKFQEKAKVIEKLNNDYMYKNDPRASYKKS